MTPDFIVATSCPFLKLFIIVNISNRNLYHRFSSKHIVSNLTSQDLRNHFLSPQAPLSHQQDHVIQSRHLFRDFLENLGYQENHRSPRLLEHIFSKHVVSLAISCWRHSLIAEIWNVIYLVNKNFCLVIANENFDFFIKKYLLYRENSRGIS